MSNFDVRKFAAAAADDKLINLDVSLQQVVQSKALTSLQRYYPDPWEVFCGNDLRFFVWPGPRGPFPVQNAALVDAVRESLGVADRPA